MPKGIQDETGREFDPAEAFTELARKKRLDENSGDNPEHEQELDPVEEQDAGEDLDASSTSGETDPQTETETETETTDIWANATQEQISAFQASQSKVAELDHRYRSSNGRVSALQKQINSMNHPEDPAPSAEREAAIKAGLTEEEIKEFEADYGDISQFIKGYAQEQIRGQVDAHIAPMQQKLSEMETAKELADARAEEDLIAGEIQRLSEAHPDYQDIQNGTEFWDWLDRKPDFIRQAINSTSADDNIELLNQFKRETNPSPGRPAASAKPDLAAHAELPRSGARRVSEDEPVDPVDFFNQLVSQKGKR